MTDRYTVYEDESGKFLCPTWWVEDSKTAEVLGPFDLEESAQVQVDSLNYEAARAEALHEFNEETPHE